MDATWKDGDDYFIRLRPIKARTVTQDDFEQKLVIQLMQLINGRNVVPTKSIGVRVQSYGSFRTAQSDMIEDVRTTLNAKYDAKKAEKIEKQGNREMRQWAIEIQEMATLLESVNRIANYLKTA